MSTISAISGFAAASASTREYTSVGSMYLAMKSFWNAAIRGGSALPAHSIGVAVSLEPVAAATRMSMSSVGTSANAPRSATRYRWYMYWPASWKRVPLTGVVNCPSGPAYDSCSAGPPVLFGSWPLLCAST